ncbi:MAG: oligosaccharide flippase family protein, partial [Planctomycetia bacterium]|nr:oligosaccharide flippase family protein [Planctomycetia bacterium]
MNTISQRLLRGGVIAVLGRSATAAGVVLVHALLARLLSPEETGLFMLALSIVTIAAVIADFGFGKTLLRTIPDAIANGDEARALSHIRLVFFAAMLTILVTALVLVSPFGTWIAEQLSHGTLLGELMPLVALWLIVTVVISLLAEACRGFHFIAEAIFFGGALTGLGNILIVSIALGIAWFSSTELSLKQVISLFILAGLFLAVLAILKLLKRLRAQRVKGDSSISRLFIMAWPFWVSSMALIL